MYLNKRLQLIAQGHPFRLEEDAKDIYRWSVEHNHLEVKTHQGWMREECHDIENLVLVERTDDQTYITYSEAVEAYSVRVFWPGYSRLYTRHHYRDLDGIECAHWNIEHLHDFSLADLRKYPMVKEA